jgi:hypothetical protein
MTEAVESEDKAEKHHITIVVNGEQKDVPKGDISFGAVVDLAFNPKPTGDNIVFTVTYRKGDGHKPDGSLLEGGSVKVKDGMIFNVTATDKS